MIKLTVAQVLQAAPALQALIKQPHRGDVAFRIRRMVLKLQPEVANAEAARDSLFTDENSELLTDDPKGPRKILPGFVKAFTEDALFSEQIEVDAIPLTPNDLKDASISPEHLMCLGPLLVEE